MSSDVLTFQAPYRTDVLREDWGLIGSVIVRNTPYHNGTWGAYREGVLLPNSVGTREEATKAAQAWAATVVKAAL